MLSRNILNNSYLFTIIAMLLVLDNIMSVYMLFIYIPRTIKQQIKLGRCNSEIQNGVYTSKCRRILNQSAPTAVMILPNHTT